jgi:hypothetical protein
MTSRVQPVIKAIEASRNPGDPEGFIVKVVNDVKGTSRKVITSEDYPNYQYNYTC